MISVKFNNTNTESFEKMKAGKVTIVSYKVVLNDTLIAQTAPRMEIGLDKSKRANSSFTITSIDFNSGIAHISSTDASPEEINFLQKPSTRIFINATTINGVVTAIVGFTASGTYSS